MTESISPALRTALDYFQAWTGHDFDRAMTYIADDIVCQAPAGRLDGGEAFRAFMEPFSKLVTRSEMLSAFGDDTTALLMYDTDTVPVRGAPGAEFLTVVGGQITQLRIIFDRAPFDAARKAAAESPPSP